MTEELEIVKKWLEDRIIANNIPPLTEDHEIAMGYRRETYRSVLQFVNDLLGKLSAVPMV